MIRNPVWFTCAVLLLPLLGLTVAKAWAAMPQAGQPAPAFDLMSQEGNRVKLGDFKGKWVVLYFYPKDFTSGCTLEAHNFQRDLDSYAKANAVILGVSVDDVNSHKSFCEKEGLQFKLLADIGGKVSGLYGSLRESQGSSISARNTFIIDPSGSVVRVFEGVQPAAHSEEVLAALGELQEKRPSK